MDNKSILDQILTNFSAEEVAKLNAPEITAGLLGELSERERDILTKRFGLTGDEKYTLETIGKLHKLTRERIRQIERAAIKKLKQLKNLEEYISGLKKVINSLIEEHGGLVEREHLLENLINFSIDGVKEQEKEREIHKNHFNFLLSKILVDEFERLEESELFKDSYKFKYASLEHFEELAKEILDKLNELNRVLYTSEIISLAKELASYHKHEEKFNPVSSLDISASLKNEFFQEDPVLINKHKTIYSLFKALKKIGQNKFGYWGLSHWKEIDPKTINEKAYLILKNHGQPMHFVGVSNKINELKFDHKKSNPASVHNELILDNKFVLVGRGLYTLKELGYEEGTVADVVEKILKEAGEPLSREEIISRVLKQRTVKRATITLSLVRNEKFERLGGDKYKLKT